MKTEIIPLIDITLFLHKSLKVKGVSEGRINDWLNRWCLLEIKLPFIPIVGDFLTVSEAHSFDKDIEKVFRGVANFKVVERHIWILPDEEIEEERDTSIHLYVLPVFQDNE